MKVINALQDGHIRRAYQTPFLMIKLLVLQFVRTRMINDPVTSTNPTPQNCRRLLHLQDDVHRPTEPSTDYGPRHKKLWTLHMLAAGIAIHVKVRRIYLGLALSCSPAVLVPHLFPLITVIIVLRC
jgi:hypothetical protein